MNKRRWFIPVFIVVLNALAVLICWNSLSEFVPAHYDLQGNAGGSMPRTMLLMYILIGAIICLGAYSLGRWKNKLQKGFVILSSGICLVIFSSSMVTLTSGTMPIFMLAEPVILLAALVGFVVCAVKARRY